MSDNCTRPYWIWCWLCFRAYLALPLPRTHESMYGRFSLWILAFAGYYAYSPAHELNAPTQPGERV